MKVLLICPPPIRIRFNISGVYPLPPLGLAYIASVLEKKNFDVEILDMPALRMLPEDLHGYFKNNNYSLYGLSCNIFNLKYGFEISRLIKRINSKAKIILGGHCNTFPPELIFEYGTDFDVIIRGEGEEVTLQLCKNLQDWGEFYNLDEIYGISYKKGNRIITSPAPAYLDLNNLPFPARHLLPNKRYRMHPPFNLYPPLTLMETSRGCNYNCTFCTLSQQLRERSVANIIEEIREVITKFGIREIHFIDPNFTYNKNRIMQLCGSLMKERLRVKWTCKTRVDLVSEDLLKAMSKAGCYMISYGVESGSQKILDSLNKDITTEDIEDAFVSSKKAKIRTLAYVLLGSPGENKNTVKETIRLVRKIRPDFVLYGELLPDPSSILVKQLIDKNKLKYNDLAKFYILNNRDIFKEKTITNIFKKNISKYLAIANKSFYFNLNYVFYRLKNLKNINDFLNLIKGVYFLILDRFKSERHVEVH